ncbi:hypothetical protein KL930_003319 [Ogataea haglerorum]|uniref:Uncharacterized protein n=1 Tax=Ogataea haglerorum TaxID=1937702 RepID=A0AAN6HZE7_9ASCO|nr:uncharacterized protein KL911_002430 [Ogataea haglerorum]KAG7696665.1 hypothetical protein KL951_003121 [Ogataea haglerorum]KAG7706891.1 hypothetical protein KL914_002775 [Ogataea haglerorum]KAG7708802.1 hypothetical protein KL950_002322 [Ogataea haglerorum]KAG7716296.1 hypothetical protein KL913_003507 [Ogataea haglerorum]KAG7717003.1 hypothetical protein KL949_003599 [Ogataea haglerorum]
MIRVFPRIPGYRACGGHVLLSKYYHNVPKIARMALDQRTGAEDGLPDSALNPADYSSVVRTIPENTPETKVLYTLSARYFPLNLKASIFDTLKARSVPAKNVLFVITFADQVLDRPLERDADLQTLRESYWRELNGYLSLYSSQTVDRENVMVTSTKYPRSVTKLFERLIQPEHNRTYYVIGQTNTGKSSLVQRLIVESNDYEAVPVVPKVSAKPSPAERIVLGCYQLHSDPGTYVQRHRAGGGAGPVRGYTLARLQGTASAETVFLGACENVQGRGRVASLASGAPVR